MNPETATTIVARPPSAPVVVATLARRELRDALASRRFIVFTALFVVLAAGVSFISLAGSGSTGFAGFSQTAAGLLNLILLIIPLVGLTTGALSIAGERERGTLLYLLSQPVARTQVLIGKLVGLSIALCTPILLGLGIAGAMLGSRTGGGSAAPLVALALLACLLSIVMIALGLAISAWARRASVSLGAAVLVWLFLVLLSDLGVMAGSLVFKLRVQEVFLLAILNPLQAFKMLVILNVNDSLDVLGPAGVYATRTFGDALPWLLTTVLAAWGMLSLIAAWLIFRWRSPT